MKSEQEIQNRKNELIAKIKAMKDDMNTLLYGEPKKNNRLLRGQYKTDALRILVDVYTLMWVLDEPITDETFNLYLLDDEIINLNKLRETKRS